MDSLVTYLWAMSPLILLVLLPAGILGDLHMKGRHRFLPAVLVSHCWKFLCEKARQMFHKKSRCDADGEDCSTPVPVLRFHFGCYYKNGLLDSSASLDQLDSEMKHALEVSQCMTSL